MADSIPENTEFLLFQADNGKITIETRMENETVWLSINQMAELFGVDKSGISRHLKNIFETGELSRNSVVAKFATTAVDNKIYQVEHYNLDGIISVGYRVNSVRGTQFRKWATERLKEYIIKGFAMNDELLKQAGGGNYFDELLQRIRDIRSSEKIFWRKVLDIYSTSIDYNPKSETSRDLFVKIQNKMHWAAHGHTAAEVIYQRVDASKENMGLSNWTGINIRKNEVSIAKNYLDKDELELLNRIVTAYLEFAELQALNRLPMYMKDWIQQLNMFLTMSGRELLEHAGKISHEQALKKAQTEYEIYHQKQLSRPSEVEKHFIEAEKEIKKLIRKGTKNE